MENNMELVDIRTELEDMTAEDREALATTISAVIAGIFHSIDRNKVMDNIAEELGKLVGDDLDKEELEVSFDDAFMTDVVDAFMATTGESVRQLIGEIGINVFADVGTKLQNICEPEKLTAGEE